MMQQQDDAAIEQYGVFAEWIGAIVERFYILSNELEIQIAETLAMSDTVGLHSAVLTQDISSVKGYLGAMNAGVVVNFGSS